MDGLISGASGNGTQGGQTGAQGNGGGQSYQGGSAYPGDAGRQNGGVQPAQQNNQGHNSGGGFDANGNWRSYFSQGLDQDTARDWESLSGRLQSPAELAKSYVHSQKELRSRVKIPGQDAGPDDWQKFHEPLAPADYKFTDPTDIQLSDEQKSYRDYYKPVFKRAGLTQWQVAQLEQAEYQAIKTQADNQRAAAQTAKARTVKTLKQEWGDDYEANLHNANGALAYYAGEDGPTLARLMLSDGTPLSAHPAFIRAFARAGAERGEDGSMPNALTAGNQQQALDQIKAIEDEAIKAGISPTDKRYPHDKLEPLYRRAYNGRSSNRQPFGARR